MEAEFFGYNPEEWVSARLLELVARHIDPTIALQINDANTVNHRRRTEIGNRYAKLLYASIPPDLGVSIEVHTDLDIMNSRVYVRIYWPMIQWRNWQPFGGGQGYGSQIYGYQEVNFFADGKGLQYFLPALAIRNRMVLVPAGQNSVFEATDEEDEVGPLQRDVIEVDFSDDAALEAAVIETGRMLRRELRREVAAYASFQQPGSWTYLDAAAHLEVPVGFVKRALQEEGEATEKAYRLLRCDIDQERIRHGRWTKIRLQVRNDSDLDFPDVTVTVSGPVQVLPAMISATLPAQETTIVELALNPADIGEFPIEIAFVLPEDQILAEWLPIHHVWLESLEPDRAP
ncbi:MULTISPECIES: hypothetical protein [Streptomyces]|uniref:DUF1822 family protein n=1 Tax=Streptomyces dengpaensis TaxID=2049881 RepID=A0ABM6T0X6_9ACTN|nr:MULTISPECIES: hypothetical protein [Streptomyces]AVH60476.1 hypothetical protein C4B68_37090 [Streptomyces dengpaensis]PIB07605.1 hypothetical protein B1C81_18955 [Streptomyces sp. HG99]